MRTIISGATIVNEERRFIGSVIIEDERIADIQEGEILPSEDHVNFIDAKGLFLFPGVIDDHVHFREPGFEYKADIASESRTAAAGGVTSYMEMPNTNPPTTTLELLEQKFEIAKRQSRVNYSFFFGATNENIDELTLLNPHRVPGVKVFMGSSTGDLLVDDDDSMRDIFEQSPLRIVAHCEDNAIIESMPDFHYVGKTTAIMAGIYQNADPRVLETAHITKEQDEGEYYMFEHAEEIWKNEYPDSEVIFLNVGHYLFLMDWDNGVKPIIDYFISIA